MKKITGKIVSHSPYEIGDGGVQLVHEVHIGGDDGTLYSVRKALVDTRHATALHPGNYGTYYFHRRLIGGNILIATQSDGKTVIIKDSPTKLKIVGGLITLMGVPGASASS